MKIEESFETATKDAPIIPSAVSYECHDLLFSEDMMRLLENDEMSDTEDECSVEHYLQANLSNGSLSLKRKRQGVVRAKVQHNENKNDDSASE
eukprot:CAMPEP_0185733830 /NCGR_PEP_ID=MMETSP1171-20130828/20630_1 /TAXON_ID=374046 /ORGANISM="Helicotheca tamensis, Strain CCMP826" /LENGTH=92 /DNA_ID=CAMNT_0028403653 /DNA_START=118 /DNA_END=393 /DNA_ORIENTATION=-